MFYRRLANSLQYQSKNFEKSYNNATRPASTSSFFATFWRSALSLIKRRPFFWNARHGVRIIANIGSNINSNINPIYLWLTCYYRRWNVVGQNSCWRMIVGLKLIFLNLFSYRSSMINFNSYGVTNSYSRRRISCRGCHKFADITTPQNGSVPFNWGN